LARSADAFADGSHGLNSLKRDSNALFVSGEGNEVVQKSVSWFAV
jgi:hypothetical protein